MVPMEPASSPALTVRRKRSKRTGGGHSSRWTLELPPESAQLVAIILGLEGGLGALGGEAVVDEEAEP
jgi:hypothetical protein